MAKIVSILLLILAGFGAGATTPLAGEWVMHRSNGDVAVVKFVPDESGTLHVEFQLQEQSTGTVLEGVESLLQSPLHDVMTCLPHHHTECVTRPVCTCAPG